MHGILSEWQAGGAHDVAMALRGATRRFKACTENNDGAGNSEKRKSGGGLTSSTRPLSEQAPAGSMELKTSHVTCLSDATIPDIKY